MSDDLREQLVGALVEHLAKIRLLRDSDRETAGIFADVLLPVVQAYADQQTAKVLERRTPWIKAQAVDDVADALLDGDADNYVVLGTDDAEPLFQWLTDTSAAIRRAATFVPNGDQP